MTLTVSPTNNPNVNESYTLTATLTSGGSDLSGQTVSIYHLVNSGTITDYTGTTNSSGVVTFTTSLANPQELSYFAYYSGNATYETVTSTQCDIVVGNTSSTIELTVDNSTPDAGVIANFTINLTNGGEPITNQLVSIVYYYESAEYTDVNSPITTDLNGNATFSESFTASGNYTYYATFAGQGIYPAATSSALDLTVLTPTAISLSSTNQNPSDYQPFILTATLTNSSTGALITSEAGVTIYHYAPGSTTQVIDVSDATTDPVLGTVTYTTSCPTAGTYTYYASLAVDDTNFYDASISAPVAINVS
jgi:hypothetical protein